jgi:hypothetical protein
MSGNRQIASEQALLRNTAADRAGSIHDDEPARKLGFRGAFVPGNVVASFALALAPRHFGERWLGGGWFDVTFVSPVYTAEPVRALGDPGDDGVLGLRVVAPDGRLCLAGRAGLGERLPWDPAADGHHGADQVTTAGPLGTPFPPRDFTLERDSVAAMLDASADATPAYRQPSTLGDPVAAPEYLMGVALRAVDWAPSRPERIRNPGMWARHALLFRAPLRYGEPYRLEERFADKGISGRARFVDFEFRVRDAAGREVAIGRHKNKWLAA